MENKQTYDLKKKDKEILRQRLNFRKKIINYAKYIFVWSVVALAIGALAWYVLTLPAAPESELVSREGIHWHANLSIVAGGEKQDVPANAGLLGAHQPIHTHDSSGTLHLEGSGNVKIDKVKLSEFFSVWGEEFNSQCILNFCNNADGSLKMLVNDEDNFEFENYQIKDGDKIEIIYGL